MRFALKNIANADTLSYRGSNQSLSIFIVFTHVPLVANANLKKIFNREKTDFKNKVSDRRQRNIVIVQCIY